MATDHGIPPPTAKDAYIRDLESKLHAAESALAAIQAKCRDLGWPDEAIFGPSPIVPIEEEPREGA